MEYKKILNLESVVNKWKWVVVSPKIWCSTIRLWRVGGSFLENICGHTVIPQIPWYGLQNMKIKIFKKLFDFTEHTKTIKKMPNNLYF